MSLIKCPECGGNVSDMAEKCPHCGISIQSNSDNNLLQNDQNDNSQQKLEPETGIKKKNRKLIISTAIVITVVAVICVVYFCLHKESLLPFGVKWGDTYEEIAKKDNLLSGGNEMGYSLWYEGEYLGLKPEEGIMYGYTFDKNGELTSMLILLPKLDKQETEMLNEKLDDLCERNGSTEWSNKDTKVIYYQEYGGSTALMLEHID